MATQSKRLKAGRIREIFFFIKLEIVRIRQNLISFKRRSGIGNLTEWPRASGRCGSLPNPYAFY